MNKIVARLVLGAFVLAISPHVASAQSKREIGDRVAKSALVLREIMDIPEGIQPGLLNKSACVAIIPSLKQGGFIFGAKYGRGVISCRKAGDGAWSPPGMIMVTGGSFGLQIGGEAVDLVLLVMNLGGLESLLDSKFTLGADASVAAGPVGRTATAETDAWMSAKILAYSRSRGAFAGLTLKGGVLRPDNDANYVLYDKEVQPRRLLLEERDVPISRDVQLLLDELNEHSPKKSP